MRINADIKSGKRYGLFGVRMRININKKQLSFNIKTHDMHWMVFDDLSCPNITSDSQDGIVKLVADKDGIAS